MANSYPNNKKTYRGSIVGSHSGTKKFYGKGRKSNKKLSEFENKEQNKWDKDVDEWIENKLKKKNRRSK